MSSGPEDPNNPSPPLFGLAAGEYVLSEWVKIAGIVIGAGALPFLIRLDNRLINLFWVFPLAAGGLMTCTGLYLAWRQALKGQDSNSAPDHRYLNAGTGLVLPWQLSVKMYLSTTGQFYKQPEVNLLLDIISLARDLYQPLTEHSSGWLLDIASQLPGLFPPDKLDQQVAPAIAQQLSLEKWLAVTQAGQVEKLREILVVVNQRLYGPQLSAGEFVTWMVQLLDEFEIGYPQDSQTEVINKFVKFLGSVDLINLDPCDLPEQLALIEKEAGRLLLNYTRLSRDLYLPLTDLSGSWLMDVTSLVLLNATSHLPFNSVQKVLQPSIDAAVARRLSLEKWLDHAGSEPPASLRDQADGFIRLRDHLIKLNKQLIASGKPVEEFVKGLSNGLNLSESPLLKNGAPAAPSLETGLHPAVPSLISISNWLISLGLLILLPGFVTLIALAGGMAYLQRIDWFFSAPAVLLWIVAEGTGLYIAWINRPSLPWQWVMLVKSILQIAGAALILIYLALSYSQLLATVGSRNTYPVWADWLLAAGVGLVVISAILASLLPFVRSPAQFIKKSSSTAVPPVETLSAAKPKEEKPFATPPVFPDEVNLESAESKGSDQDAPAEKPEGKEMVS